MSRHLIFVGVIVFLVSALAVMIWYQERIVRTGEEVILATRPVDPRDLFRGEYVILRYVIERDQAVLSALRATEIPETVYVQLTPDAQRVAQVQSISYREPDWDTGIWIRGESDGRSVRFPQLEQYYVPEGAGRPIERLRSGLHVQVRVLDGEARVVGLLDAELQPIDVQDYVED